MKCHVISVTIKAFCGDEPELQVERGEGWYWQVEGTNAMGSRFEKDWNGPHDTQRDAFDDYTETFSFLGTQ